jgi:cbb3-type cytochrome oxidase subunit 3
MIKKSSGGKGPANTLWIIAGLYFSMMLASVIIFFNSYKASFSSNSLSYTKILLLPVAWTSLMIVEGILLWKFRAVMNRPQAWIHVVCMFGCFILTFLFTLFGNFYIARLGGHSNVENMFRLIQKINLYSFWAFFIMGHIFFISVVVQRFSRNNKNKIDEPSSGILDEFAD